MATKKKPTSSKRTAIVNTRAAKASVGSKLKSQSPSNFVIKTTKGKKASPTGANSNYSAFRPSTTTASN